LPTFFEPPHVALAFGKRVVAQTSHFVTLCPFASAAPLETWVAPQPAVLLSGSPAAKLLARVQRQIAAHERTWYRANTELRRARKPAGDAAGNSLDNYLERFHAATAAQLASIRQSTATAPPDSPTAPASPKAWPPVDEKTGRPLYFVG
jgi:hypothetical protein